MTESDALAEGFEQNRTRLRAVAYRMLGSLAEADDAVQETWLRLSRSDASGVDNLGAWLTTIVARVSLNVLRSRRTQREEPMGVHVPDPVISPADGTNPEEQALLADSVGLALQVVLDTLTPAERLAFVLHDLFDLPFDEIALIVGRSAATTRQLASRARRRVREAEVSRGRIAEIDILADPERLRRADLAVLGGPAPDAGWAKLGAAPGLCLTCRHARLNQTRRGTAYLRCGRSAWDDRLVRYPRLPVIECAGFEARETGPGLGS